MQAALRGAAAELAKGVSTGLVCWGGRTSCPACLCEPHLTCGEIRCPDCVCGSGVRLAAAAAAPCGSRWLTFLNGFVVGALVVSALVICAAAYANGYGGQAAARGSPAPVAASWNAASPRPAGAGSSSGGMGLRALRGRRAATVASETEDGQPSGVLGD